MRRVAREPRPPRLRDLGVAVRRAYGGRASLVGVAAALVAIAAAAPCAVGASAQAATSPLVVTMTAKRFEYAPETITARVGVPLVLEITALDHDHGFALPAFGVRADLKQGTTTRIEIVPDRVGTFAFHCDVFCGDGHEGMTGTLQVTQ